MVVDETNPRLGDTFWTWDDYENGYETLEELARETDYRDREPVLKVERAISLPPVWLAKIPVAWTKREGVTESRLVVHHTQEEAQAAYDQALRTLGITD